MTQTLPTAGLNVGWAPGSYHYLWASTPQVVGGIRYEFVEWEDKSTALLRLVQGGSTPKTYTAKYAKKYGLTTKTNPAGAGTVSPAGSTWYTDGSQVPVTQTGIGDYAFTGWSGACSGTGACTVTMDSSKEVTANYVLGLKYKVETNPAGRQVTVDGQTYPSPKTFTWIPGSTHAIGVASPQAGTAGTRYVYQGWGDGGAQTHTVTVPQTTATYTVNFTTQYQLTTGVTPSGSGSVTPAPLGEVVDGARWYDSGVTVQLTAGASSGFAFAGWSGALTGLTNPSPLVMNGPKTATAGFDVSNTITTDPAVGMQMSVEFVTQTLPTAGLNVGWAPGSYHYLWASTPQVVGGIRYDFVEWEDKSTALLRLVQGGSTPKTYTAKYAKKYGLTTKTNPANAGTVSPAGSTWYTDGSQVPVTQTGIGDYAFTGWSGACSGTGACTVTMDSSKEVTANYVLGLKYKVETNPVGT